MDNNFVQFIFILILVISFLSKLFKKDKQNKANPPQGQAPPRPGGGTSVEYNPGNKKDENYDILREIESLFKGEVQVPRQTQEYKPATDKKTAIEKSEEDRLAAKPSYSEHAGTYSEHYFREDIKKQQDKFQSRIPKIDKQIDEQAERFKKILEQKEKQKNMLKLSVVSKLKHPATLKEFIFISEILGKPKALRR